MIPASLQKKAYDEGFLGILKQAQGAVGTGALSAEEDFFRQMAALPVVAQLGGQDYNIRGARERFKELGLPEEKLSWATQNPSKWSLGGAGLFGLLGAGSGALLGGPYGAAGALAGAGVGGTLGALTGAAIPAGIAYHDLMRADNLAMQEMRREQVAKARGKA